MATSELELRVSALEKELAKLKEKLARDGKSDLPWWKQISGAFADDPLFDEAMRLGREYRVNLREEYDDEPDDNT